MTTTTSRMYHWGRGLELRLEREDLGLTMEELGTYLRVNARTMQRWESDTDPIPEDMWGQLEAVASRLNDRMNEQIETLIDDVATAGYPEFYVVPARHMRQRRVAVAAQDMLRESLKPTRLVTEAGMAMITSHGYADPLVTNTP